jgi:hypothetical protein
MVKEDTQFGASRPAEMVGRKEDGKKTSRKPWNFIYIYLFIYLFSGFCWRVDWQVEANG